MQQSLVYCAQSVQTERLLFREKPFDSESGSDVFTEDEDEQELDEEKGIHCRICGHTITSSRQKFSRSGTHHHTFFNPAGIVYEIGCFRQAPGCLVYGPVSHEFAWFSGYGWQISYCDECAEHLGWYFTGLQDSFFGLVIARLRED